MGCACSKSLSESIRKRGIRGPFVINSSDTGWLSTYRILNIQCRIHQRNSNMWTYRLITTESNCKEPALAGVLGCTRIIPIAHSEHNNQKTVG